MINFFKNLRTNVINKWKPTTWLLLTIPIIISLLLFAFTLYIQNNSQNEIIEKQKQEIGSLNATVIEKTNQILNLTNAIFQVATNGNSISADTNLKLSSLLNRSGASYELNGTNNTDIFGLNKLIASNDTMKINLAVFLSGTDPAISISLLENVSDTNYKIKYFLLGNIYESTNTLDQAFASYSELFDREVNPINRSNSLELAYFSAILCNFTTAHNYSTNRVNVTSNGQDKSCQIRSNDRSYTIIVGYKS